MMFNEGEFREPEDENECDLFCFRDNTTASADSPQCLHPSSFCEFRESCPIREAERAIRRDARRQEEE
jgi:hypothetical protein